MAHADQGYDPHDVAEASAGKPAEKLVIELHVFEPGQGRQLGMGLEDRDRTPGDQDDDHDGRDFHDPESFVAALVNALDVLPPEVADGNDAERGREIVLVEVERMFQVARYFFNEAGEVLTGSDCADGSRENVVEQQG